MIKINDKYSIDSLKDSVVLYEYSTSKKGKNKGEKVLSRSRFYPSLKYAYLHLVDIAGIELTGKMKSFDELIDEIRSLKRSIFVSLP